MLRVKRAVRTVFSVWYVVCVCVICVMCAVCLYATGVVGVFALVPKMRPCETQRLILRHACPRTLKRPHIHSGWDHPRDLLGTVQTHRN